MIRRATDKRAVDDGEDLDHFDREVIGVVSFTLQRTSIDRSRRLEMSMLLLDSGEEGAMQ